MCFLRSCLRARLHGRDVLAEMAAQGLTQAVPVIVVTGDPNPVLNKQHFACVLQKPISPEKLTDAVRDRHPVPEGTRRLPPQTLCAHCSLPR